MLYEHFIEPDVLAKLAESKRNCKDFVKEFTKPSPRVISDFPKFKKFRRLAFTSQSASASDMAQLRLVELISFIGSQTRVDRSSIFNGEVTWKENIERAAHDVRGDCILVTSNKPNFDFIGKVVCLNDFDNGIESLPTQATVTKTTKKIVEAIQNLLRLSSHILFVDPYFSDRSQMWKPMIAYIEASLAETPNQKKNIQVIYSAEKPNLPQPCFLLDKFRTENRSLYEKLDSLTFKMIKTLPEGEALHNRYIITELDAIHLGIGLDSRSAFETDDFVLLDEAGYQKRYEQYMELNAFDLVEEASS